MLYRVDVLGEGMEQRKDRLQAGLERVGIHSPTKLLILMEGESLGGRWWVLRFKKGGGKAEQIPRLCFKVKLLLACASPSLRSINSCIIIIMGGCGWGSPPCGGDGGGWSGGSREPTNFAFDNSAYR